MVPVDISDGCDPIVRGDFYKIEILPELDADGNVVELSNYGTTWTAKLRPNPDSSTALSFNIDTTNVDGSVDNDPATPRLILSLTGVQTGTLDQAQYGMDLQVTGGTESPLTLYKATIPMQKDYTY